MRYIQQLIITLILTASYTGIYSQCTSGSFNCNDTIQVSVDVMCEAIISADVLLEAPNANCTYFLRFFDENGNEINVPNNTLTKDHVGKLLKVTVEEAGVNNPNSCWSYLRVEDKISSTFECPDLGILSCVNSGEDDPGMGENIKTLIRNKINSQNLIQDNCSNIEDYEISVEKNDFKPLVCSGDFGARRIVKYKLFNPFGRELLDCEDTIFYTKFDPDELMDPVDFIGDNALECDGTWKNGIVWDTDADQEFLDSFDINVYPNVQELFEIEPKSFPHDNSGNPVVTYDPETNEFRAKGYCNINVAFTDLPPFESCGKSYKLIRSWTIIDWCKQSDPKFVNQIIEVRDTKPPEFNVPDIPDVEAGTNTCNMVVDLPEPNVTDECNDWTYCIAIKYPEADDFVIRPEYKDLDTSDVVDPVILPIGITRIKYIVKDLCENEDSMVQDVEVIDVQPPIAICDTRTVLTLNNNDVGKIFPPTIDDKSFDNCTENLGFRIWREDGNTALNAPDSSYVKFNADDIDQDVRVMLEVTDEGGLMNRCWTTVEVKSNTSIAPLCPSEATTLDFCDSFDSYLPEAADLLAVEISRETNICGEGFLVVQWIDTAQNINVLFCSDTIYFESINSISTSDFALPLDISISECDDNQPTPQDLGNILGTSNACNVEVIFQDVVFLEKIFRNYTVLDLCTGIALMQHTQIIEIIPQGLDDVDISTIFDCPNPGITIDMEVDGTLEVTGHDINSAVGDECYTDLDIRIRIRGEGDFTESITFVCDDLAVFVVFDIEIALYDRDGSFLEMCHTKILIDDRTSQACPAGSVIDVFGSVLTENQEAVENVSIELRTLSNQKAGETITSVNGQYAFSEMDPEQYQIITTRNDDIINGVSTLDLVLIQQHILGLKYFDSPYKVIAADVNNNQQVSASDLIELRKVILGISDSYTNNSSWRFAQVGEIFSDILNPWPFNEIMDVNGSGEFNFIGIKIGDVNSNAIANSLMTSSRSADHNLAVTDNGISKGKIEKLTFKTKDLFDDISAFQIRLNINSEMVKILEIYDGNGRPINKEEYAVVDDQLTISHINLKLESEMFTIEFEGLVNTESIAKAISLSDYKNEWYSYDYNTYGIGQILFEKNKESLEVQVSPNPFSESTTLTIYSDISQSGSLKVFDINGQEVYNKSNIRLTKGDNSITLSSSDLSGHSGIFIYNLEFGRKNVRGKMIYLN